MAIADVSYTFWMPRSSSLFLLFHFPRSPMISIPFVPMSPSIVSLHRNYRLNMYSIRSCDHATTDPDLSIFFWFLSIQIFPLSDIFQETNRRFFRVYLIRVDRLHAFLSTNSIHNNNKSADEDHRLKIPSRLDDNRDESGASTSSVESIERSSSSRSTGGLQYTIH